VRCLALVLLAITLKTGVFQPWCVYFWWYVGGHLVVGDVVWEVYHFHNSVLKMLIYYFFLKTH